MLTKWITRQFSFWGVNNMKPPFANSWFKFDAENKTIVSAGKSFKVRMMTYEIKVANEFMQNHPETAIVDTDETGLMWITNLEAEENKK